MSKRYLEWKWLAIWNIYWLAVLILMQKKMKKPIAQVETWVSERTYKILKITSYYQLDIEVNEEVKYYQVRVNKFQSIHVYFIKVDENSEQKYASYYQSFKIAPSIQKQVAFTTESTIILFDRPNKADDNAEAVYKKLQSEYSNIYFVIEQDCPDYERLQAMNFKVVAFRTPEFEQLYLNADFVLSSSYDGDIIDYKQMRSQTHFKFIFLQHGVFINDLSTQFTRSKINKVVVSTIFEQQQLAKLYPFYQEQLITSRLPRFDRLVANKQVNSQILINFTWRSYLRNDGEVQADLQLVGNSNYYHYISELLGNENFLKLLEQYNTKVKFILHPGMNSVKTLFSKFENHEIEIIDSSTSCYCDLVNSSDLLITDYSSVFADFTCVNKPVIFYQFDYDEFFSKHLHRPLLKYGEEIPGVVCTDIEQVTNEISEILAGKKQTNRQFFIENQKSATDELIEQLKESYYE